MDTKYVYRKEGAEGGSAFAIMFANAALLSKLLSSPGDCKDQCIVSVVFLFLSLIVHAIIEMLLIILARLETRNEKLREKAKKKTGSEIEEQKTDTQTWTNDRKDLTDKVNTKGDGIEEKKPDTQTPTNGETELKDKENTNDKINDVIFALTYIGVVLNVIIGILEIKGN